MSLLLERDVFDCNVAFGNPYAGLGTGAGVGAGVGMGAEGSVASVGAAPAPASPSLSTQLPPVLPSTATVTGYPPAPSLLSTGAPPAGGTYKLLEINLISVGHDSERLTSSIEASTVGHPLNFITGRPAHFLIPVRDTESGFGRLAESLLFRCANVLPIIRVNSAVYGNLKDVKRLIDVTPEIQGLVKVPFPYSRPTDSALI